MPKVVLRFYNKLNELLPEHRRNSDLEAEFKDKRSVKDMIESFGVPHTEVDIILANGKSVDFNYILRKEDQISVYPALEKPEIENPVHLCPVPPFKTRFIADIHLGDIVKYMRALGFDVYDDPGLSNRDIIERSQKEERIIITKSRKLLKFKEVVYGLLLCVGTTEVQVKDIITRLDISDRIKPFSRCLCCNNILINIPKEEIEDKIPPKTRSFCDQYAYCESCHRIYWEGTHVIKMRKVINRVLDKTNGPGMPDSGHFAA